MAPQIGGGSFMGPSLVVGRAIEGTAVKLDLGREQPLARGRTGAVLGLTSAALLFASFRWAHHWGLLSGGIVVAWALATIAAFVVSVWSLRTSRASRRFALVGLALTLVSLLALTLAGVFYAAGADVSGACGGG
jgi:hypothetical protein